VAGQRIVARTDRQRRAPRTATEHYYFHSCLRI
jgi:hypothetical protein